MRGKSNLFTRTLSFLLSTVVVFTTVCGGTTLSAYADEFDEIQSNAIAQELSNPDNEWVALDEETQQAMSDDESDTLIIFKNGDKEAVITGSELADMAKPSIDSEVLSSSTTVRPANIPDWLECNEEADVRAAAGADADIERSASGDTLGGLKSLQSLLKDMPDTPASAVSNAASVKVLLVQTSLPWKSNANTTMLNTLKTQGYIGSYDVISMSAVATTNLSQYNIVMLANDQTTASYNSYSSVKARLENYATGGGVVVFGACDGGWGGSGTLSDTLPGGVKKISNYQSSNYIADATSPVVTGSLTGGNAITNSMLSGNYCSHVSFDESTLPKGYNVILRGSSDNRPTLVQYSYGKGTIIASGLTWEYYYGSSGTYSYNGYKNLIVYALSLNGGVTEVPVFANNEATVEGTTDQAIYEWVQQMPDLNVDFGNEVSGPSISVFGYNVPLFSMGKMAIKGKLGSKIKPAVEIDLEKKTVKVIIGYSDEAKATLQEAAANDKNPSHDGRTQYGMEYQELKEMYKFITGGDMSKGNTTAWNKYQKRRSKLQKYVITDGGKIALKANIQVTGFFQFSYETGSLVLSEGGIMVLGEVGGSYKYQPNVLYVTTGLTGTADIGVNITYGPDGKPKFKNAVMDFKLDLNAAVGAGAKDFKIFGKKVDLYIEGGTDGIIGLEINTSSNPWGDIYAQVKAYIKGKAGPFERTFVQKTFPDNEAGKWILWPKSNNGKAAYTRDELDIRKVSAYEVMSRDYLDESAASIQSVSNYEFAQFNIYPYAAQTIIETDDGTRMLVWVGDNGSKDDIDRTTIFYSVFDGEGWSSVKSVYESGTYMDSPVVFTVGDKVYVAWIQADRSFGNTGDAETVLKACDVYVSEYSDGKFSSPVCVSGESDGVYESNIALCADADGNVYVYWLENETNIFGGEGTTVIKTASRLEGSWSSEATVYETDSNIASFAVDCTAGTPEVIVAINSLPDEEGNVPVSVSRLVAGSLETIAENISAAQVVDGVLFYASDNTIFGYNIAEQLLVEIAAIPQSADFKIVSNGSDAAILAIFDDELTNEIYVAHIDGSEETMWEQFTNFGRYIRDYSAIMLPNGEIKAAVNTVEVQHIDGYDVLANSADLLITGEQDVTDLAVLYATYDEETLEGGSDLNINYSIANLGNTDIEGYTVTVTDGDGNTVATQNSDDSVYSGAIVDAVIAIPVSDVITRTGYTLMVSAASDSDATNNEVDFEIGLAELKFTGLYTDATGFESGIYGGTIVNTGFSDSENVTVEVYSDALRSELIATIDAGVIAAGSEFSFEKVLPEELMRVSSWGTLNALYFDIITDTEECNSANNEDKVVFDTLANTKVKLEVHNADEVSYYIFALDDAYAFPAELILPEREGYFFAGWYKDAEYQVPYSTGEYPQGDVVIYAKWLTAPEAEAASGSYSSIKINWNKIAGASIYEVEKLDSETGEYYTLYSNSGNTYYDNNLVTGVEYTYRVRMRRTTSLGEEQYSDYTVLTAKPELDVIANVEALSIGKNTVTLSWDSIQGATGYVIYRRDKEKGEFELVETINTTSTVWVDTGLDFDEIYEYKVGSLRSYGDYVAYSELSDVLTVKTILPTPFITSLTMPSATSVTLEWEEITGAEGYYVYQYDFETEEYKYIKSVKPGDITSTTVKYLTTGENYRFAIKAFCTKSTTRRESEFSEYAETVLLPTTSITTIKAVDYKHLEVKWNEVSVGDGYDIYYSTSKNGEYLYGGHVYGLTDTSYLLGGLKTGTTYYIKVCVTNGSAKGALSSARYAKVALATPELTVDSDGTTAILTWDKVEGATSYMVCSYNAETDEYTTIRGLKGGDTLSYTINNLVLGEKYSYSVRAVMKDDEGKNHYSKYAKPRTLTMRLKAPATISLEQVSADSIKVTWAKSKDATGYFVRVLRPGQDEYTLAKNVTSGDTTEFVMSKLELGGTYTFKINAYAAVDGHKYTSEYSDEVTMTVVLLPVTGITAVDAENGGVELTWNEVGRADGYNVLRRNYGSSSYSMNVRVEGQSVTSYVDETAVAGTRYEYTVQAYSDSYAYASEIVEIVNIRPMDKVSDLAVVADECDSLKLTWSKVAADRYEIRRASSEKGTYELIATVSGSVTEFIDTGLTIGSRYYYTITPVVSETTGPESEIAYCKVAMGTPTANISHTSLTSVEITWEAVKNATGYVVYRYDGSDYVYYKKITDAETLSFTDTKCVPGSEYSYKVRSFGTFNEKTYYSDYSESVDAIATLEAVQNFTGVTGETEIEFSWTAMEAAEGYVIYEIKNNEYVPVATIEDATAESYVYSFEHTGALAYIIKAFAGYEGTIYYGYYDNVVTSEYYVKEVDSTSAFPECAHSYSNNMNQSWQFEYVDAVKMDITFNTSTAFESNCDFLYIYDGSDNLIGRYSGTTLSGKTIQVPGSVVKFKLTTDSSSVYYGFKIDYITGYMEQGDVLDHLSIKTEAAQLKYDLYEELNLSGLRLYATYENGVVRTVRPEQFDSVEYDFNDPGTRDVTVTYGGKSFTYQVEVSNLYPVETYNNGDFPESAHSYSNNMNQTWNYSKTDAKKFRIHFSESSFFENNYDKLNIYNADGSLQGTYTGSALAGKTIETIGESFKLNMTSDSSSTYYGFSIDMIEVFYEREGNLEYLESISPANKLSYILDDETDFTGLVLRAVYDNDVVKTVFPSQFENVEYDFSTPGESQITVYYGGKSFTYDIIVRNLVNYDVDPAEKAYPESSHNYSNNMNQTQTFTYEGAAEIVLYFSANCMFENNYDRVYITDASGNSYGSFTGSELANKIIHVPGNTVNIRLYSDGSNTNYGYSLDRISVYLSPEDEEAKDSEVAEPEVNEVQENGEDGNPGTEYSNETEEKESEAEIEESINEVIENAEETGDAIISGYEAENAVSDETALNNDSAEASEVILQQ